MIVRGGPVRSPPSEVLNLTTSPPMSVFASTDRKGRVLDVGLKKVAFRRISARRVG